MKIRKEIKLLSDSAIFRTFEIWHGQVSEEIT